MNDTKHHSSGRDAVEIEVDVDVESVDIDDVDHPLDAIAVAKALDEASEEHAQEAADLLFEARTMSEGQGIDLPATPAEVPRSDFGGRAWVVSLEDEISFSLLAALTAMVERKRKAAIAMNKCRRLRQRIDRNLDDLVGRIETTAVRGPPAPARQDEPPTASRGFH